MNCVICSGNEIVEKEVFEEIKSGYDIIFVPMKVLTCNNCGERYYNRRAIKMIENIEEQTLNKMNNLKEIGKVLMYDEAVV